MRVAKELSSVVQELCCFRMRIRSQAVGSAGMVGKFVHCNGDHSLCSSMQPGVHIKHATDGTMLNFREGWPWGSLSRIEASAFDLIHVIPATCHLAC